MTHAQPGVKALYFLAFTGVNYLKTLRNLSWAVKVCAPPPPAWGCIPLELHLVRLVGPKTVNRAGLVNEFRFLNHRNDLALLKRSG